VGFTIPGTKPQGGTIGFEGAIEIALALEGKPDSAVGFRKGRF
jgi:hypothetical protein